MQSKALPGSLLLDSHCPLPIASASRLGPPRRSEILKRLFPALLGESVRAVCTDDAESGDRFDVSVLEMEMGPSLKVSGEKASKPHLVVQKEHVLVGDTRTLPNDLEMRVF